MTLTGLTGATYHLGPTPIGSGGEGDIYRILGEGNKVAKILTAPGASRLTVRVSGIDICYMLTFSQFS